MAKDIRIIAFTGRCRLFVSPVVQINSLYYPFVAVMRVLQVRQRWQRFTVIYLMIENLWSCVSFCLICIISSSCSASLLRTCTNMSCCIHL